MFRCFHASFVCVLISLPALALAQHPNFKVHTINAESEFSACAAIDVNRDGKLDIVSGGFWYEAPDWTKHFLREVEVIRRIFSVGAPQQVERHRVERAE